MSAKATVAQFRCDDEWWAAIQDFALYLGLSGSELIRDSVPDHEIMNLYKQARPYYLKLEWKEDVVKAALRKHLGKLSRDGRAAHLKRVGLDPDKLSAGKALELKEKATQRMLKDLERAKIGDMQLNRARSRDPEAFCYLGLLHEALMKAGAGEPGYRVAEVSIDWTKNAPKGTPQEIQKEIMVLVNGKAI